MLVSLRAAFIRLHPKPATKTELHIFWPMNTFFCTDQKLPVPILVCVARFDGQKKGTFRQKTYSHQSHAARNYLHYECYNISVPHSKRK
ncbi:MAG: hypothetical protein QOJ40_2952 [Verrucomicrobiota bacterium]